jgi:hypothetical protein
MLAGTLRFMDLDDFELGHSNLELAMTAAHEAEAGELGAFVLGCMASMPAIAANARRPLTSSTRPAMSPPGWRVR